jgi:hypothetical protein
MTHKSEDYKISAVKYYLKNKDNIRFIKKQEFINWFRRTSKTKIYTLCEGQTLLIFMGFLSHFNSSRV